MRPIVLCELDPYAVKTLPPPQLFPHKHSRPHYQSVRRPGDSHLWEGWGARAHAEVTGPGEQVGRRGHFGAVSD